MAQTFDIRFARADGIAALFGATANSLGWKGGGRLSIDAQGMSFALKRGIASLLARRRSQRIPAENIVQVYREGDALRLEFATDDNPRAVLPFWARNREAASQIVQLLPTLRTFEVEHGPAETRGKQTRASWIQPVAVVVVLAAAAFIFSMKRPTVSDAGQAVAPVQGGTPTATPAKVPVAAESIDQTTDTAPVPSKESDRFTTPDEARKLAILAEDPVDWTKPPPRSNEANAESIGRRARPERMAEPRSTGESESEAEAFVPMEIPEIQPRPEQLVVGIPQTTLAYGSARDLLAAFETGARDLTRDFQQQREDFDQGTLDRQKFADRLDWYALRWRNLGERVLEDRRFSDTALTGLRATLLTVVIQQRDFLSGYAEGLRTRDQPQIDRAFAELARADAALARARQYLN